MSNINIQSLALRAGFRTGEIITSDGDSTSFVSPASATDCKTELERFADLYREALFAGLLAGSGEPVAYLYHDADSAHSADPMLHSVLLVTAKSRMSHCRNETPLRTADQLAAAVLREREKSRALLEALLMAEAFKEGGKQKARAAISQYKGEQA